MAQVFAHVDEFLNGHGHFYQGVKHVLFAHFDFFGDNHLAIAVQQGYGPHLTQVHAHGVCAARGIVGGFLIFGKVQRAFGYFFVVFSGGGNFFAVFFRIHDGDFQLLKNADYFFKIFRCVHFHGQGLVDLFKSQKAGTFAFGNKRLYLLDIFKIAHGLSPKFP